MGEPHEVALAPAPALAPVPAPMAAIAVVEAVAAAAAPVVVPVAAPAAVPVAASATVPALAAAAVAPAAVPVVAPAAAPAVVPAAVPAAAQSAASSERDAPISSYQLEGMIHCALAGRDLSSVTLGGLRAELCQRLGLPGTSLDSRQQEIKDMTEKVVHALTANPDLLPAFMQIVLADLQEKATARQYIYFVTISRLLPATRAQNPDMRDVRALSREDIVKAILDSLDNPIVQGGRAGRPRNDTGSRVAALVAFQEKHADGSLHYHVAIKLKVASRFATAKHTLRERHHLPSHWSCSHTQFWSAVRYGFIPSPKKPVVDSTPAQWTSDGKPLDLFACSQEPFQADMWRRRREECDKEAAKLESKVTFTKLDLTSLIISKHLYTKDSLIAYVQDFGTAVMQSYVNRVQRKLTEYLVNLYFLPSTHQLA